MPRSVDCRLGSEVIGIEEALQLRANARQGERLPLRCVECGQPVRAHRKGSTGQAAHFEHLKVNPACPRSTADR